MTNKLKEEKVLYLGCIPACISIQALDQFHKCLGIFFEYNAETGGLHAFVSIEITERTTIYEKGFYEVLG